MGSTLHLGQTALLEEIERRSGAPVSACLQCHKCSTGCPVGPEADYLPSQIMRLIHLGEEEELLGSQAIWLCASCEACTTRCPMDIDIAAVIDTLKMLAVERQVAVAGSRGKQFNKSFLSSVRRNGRVFELGMMTFFKLRTGDFFSDVEKVPKMFAQGKLALLPHFSRSKKEVRQVFERAEEEEKKR